MISATWFLNSFLMKTVIYDLAHVRPFLFADNKRLLHLYPFICSPLHAWERSPFSLMVQAPRMNNLLENQEICFPDRTTGMSGPHAASSVLTTTPVPACISFTSTTWAIWASCARLKRQHSHTLLHTYETMRCHLTWVVRVIFKSYRWGMFSFSRNKKQCFLSPLGNVPCF